MILLFSPTDNCLYKGWLIPSAFTPSAPDDFKVNFAVRENMKGDLEPVIVAEWKAKDDGRSLVISSVSSITLLNAKCVHQN